MDTGYLVLFGLGIGLIAFLIWMLYPIPDKVRDERKDKIKGKCPICDQGLMKGERVRSDITELGDYEVQTKIKGCPFCFEDGKRKRTCPVCKKKLAKDEVILAISDPRVDRRKLSIKGCSKCYPQGF